jgi:multiple sugar transport system permease protein
MTVIATIRRAAGREQREALIFLVPAMVPVALFSVVPLAVGIYLGFTDSVAGVDVQTHFTWLDNYARLLGNTLFWQSFVTGLIWAFGVTAIQGVLGLILALLLNERLRLRWLARTLALVPWAMPSVIVAIMWRMVYHPDAGVLNVSLVSVGILDRGVNWLGGVETAFAAIVVVGVWAGLPQTTVALLAGLQGIPRELHEAAAVDGANAGERFRHITLPQIRPVADAIFSLNFIWNFNAFGLVYVLTAGGPGGRTMLPALFAYNEGFRYGNFGYAAAMGNAMVLVIVALLFVYLRRRLKAANA